MAYFVLYIVLEIIPCPCVSSVLHYLILIIPLYKYTQLNTLLLECTEYILFEALLNGDERNTFVQDFS